ncbi:hypothetical protein BH23ACT10_BH23ACT10_05820 [soil metagenome]
MAVTLRRLGGGVGVAAVVLLVSAAALVIGAAPASAHPLGNFTTNTSTALTLHPDRIAVTYVVDLAEIPAFRARGDLDTDGDDTIADEETQGYARRECARLAPLLQLSVDRRPSPLRVTSEHIALPPGEAGLTTLRLRCDLQAAAVLDNTHQVTFTDTAFGGRTGWREVTATGEGVPIADSDVPAASASNRLRTYPDADVAAPLNQRSATLTVRPGPVAAVAAAAGAPDGVVTTIDLASTRLSTLVAARELTLLAAASAFALALGLGAVHALAPGHGKTVMAAYLVGRQGTSRQAVALGTTVAVTHTLGVLLLGVLLSTSQAIAPERLYPWLGTGSGLLFTAIGVQLLSRAWRARRDDSTHHHHSDVHDDHDRAVTWRTLALPGLAGGLVPSPSALLVLLGGIALGRAWFGLSLVVAYGIGMAATLVGAGYLLVRASSRLTGPRWRWTTRLAVILPVATAVLIVVGGLAFTARSLATL